MCSAPHVHRGVCEREAQLERACGEVCTWVPRLLLQLLAVVSAVAASKHTGGLSCSVAGRVAERDTLSGWECHLMARCPFSPFFRICACPVSKGGVGRCGTGCCLTTQGIVALAYNQPGGQLPVGVCVESTSAFWCFVLL